MNPAAKLAGFALVLALVFGGSTLAGRALDPFGDEPATESPMPGHTPTTEHIPGGHPSSTTAPDHTGHSTTEGQP